MLGQPNELLLLSKTLVYPVCVSVITLFHIAILSTQVPSAVRQGWLLNWTADDAFQPHCVILKIRAYKITLPSPNPRASPKWYAVSLFHPSREIILRAGMLESLYLYIFGFSCMELLAFRRPGKRVLKAWGSLPICVWHLIEVLCLILCSVFGETQA